MAKYLAKAKELSVLFRRFSIKNVPRNQNQKANVLSKLASVAFNYLMKEVMVEVLNTKSIDTREVSAIVEEEKDNWMTLVIRCLEEGIWSADENEARTLWMKIMANDHGLQKDILVALHEDTKVVVDKCDSCQIYAPVPRFLKTRLTSVMSLWPFYQWGLDILGPFLEGLGKLKFIIVAIDYFTKWMEVKPLAKNTSKEARKFVLENIICRYVDFNEAQHEEEMRLNLDLIQERRETTAIR
ncbi:reverse transcriptase domain-containing protein [Tanacetum coccineum]